MNFLTSFLLYVLQELVQTILMIILIHGQKLLSIHSQKDIKMLQYVK